MSHRTLLFSAALVLFTASAAHAGPPWISIEMPANPHHASTRGAALMVRAYHHSTSLNMPVRGTAEGIVDGRRVSLPLDIAATNQPGVFALNSPLPKGGTWILAITATQGEEATATALVTVDAAGRVVSVNVPSNRTRDGWTVPRRVEQREIESALRSAHAALGDNDDSRPSFAYALPLLLVGVAAALSRRRQTSV
jgi:MYXO-CTERM domain-containing protein